MDQRLGAGLLSRYDAQARSFAQTIGQVGGDKSASASENEARDDAVSRLMERGRGCPFRYLTRRLEIPAATSSQAATRVGAKRCPRCAAGRIAVGSTRSQW